VPDQSPAEAVRSFRTETFDARALADAKDGRRISVCLPARDEEPTVGLIVAAICADLVDAVRLVDEVVVVDDHSSDGTSVVAESAGARVVDASMVLRDHGRGHGKGQAMWKSLHEASGDLIVWCDTDICDFDTQFVVGLVGPLLMHPELTFAKGFYERPTSGPLGGGRVTELVARPLLSMFFPALTGIVQPLAGEYAIWRSVAERLPFTVGYGVDVGLLIDTYRTQGIEALAQVDLGVRRHRNRPLDQLGPQALAVAQAILHRAGIAPSETVELLRPGVAPLTVSGHELPPMTDVASYRASV